MSRIDIFKGDEVKNVKENRLERFLEQGWQLVAEPAPKKISKAVKTDKEVKVTANADVVKEEDPYAWEAPLISMPTDNQ